MDAKHQAFIKDLKAVLDKHNVTFAKDHVYYDGDSPNERFVLPGESYGVFSFDDMVELCGGYKEKNL